MPSATAADSSDSMAPSMAIVNAAGTSVTSRSNVTSGTRKCGSPRGISPNALAMVATPSKWNVAWIAVATSIAINGPGTRDRPGTRGP